MSRASARTPSPRVHDVKHEIWRVFAFTRLHRIKWSLEWENSICGYFYFASSVFIACVCAIDYICVFVYVPHLCGQMIQIECQPNRNHTWGVHFIDCLTYIMPNERNDGRQDDGKSETGTTKSIAVRFFCSSFHFERHRRKNRRIYCDNDRKLISLQFWHMATAAATTIVSVLCVQSKCPLCHSFCTYSKQIHFFSPFQINRTKQ